MLKSKTVLVTILFLFILHANAQNNSEILITCNGVGKNIEESKKNAFINALSQVVSSLSSSNTSIIKNEFFIDLNTSNVTEKIKSYEVINQSEMPNGNWITLLKVNIDLQKLAVFVNSKGLKIDFNGSAFVNILNQEILKEEAEIKSISELVGLLHEPMQISFDYQISTDAPLSLDKENKFWNIPIKIFAICNKNMIICTNYCFKILSAVSLSYSDIQKYTNLNKKIYPISTHFFGKNKTFFLRTQTALNILQSFASNWNFYSSLFKIDVGIDTIYTKGELNYLNYNDKYNEYSFNKSNIDLTFFNVGDTAAIYLINDKRTLSQINKINNYHVYPKGIISLFKNGGYVLNEFNGHGIIVSTFDIGKFGWNEAKRKCDELLLNDYNDWRLPTKVELISIYNNLFKQGIGGFDFSDYWSNTEVNNSYAWTLNFLKNNVIADQKNKNDLSNVRLVRFY